MVRALVLILLLIALGASLTANVQLYTRPPSDVRNGSIDYEDLAPSVKAGLRGEQGPRGFRGFRGPEGAQGEPGLMGAPGVDGADYGWEVEELQSRVDDLCSTGLVYGIRAIRSVSYTSYYWNTISC